MIIRGNILNVFTDEIYPGGALPFLEDAALQLCQGAAPLGTDIPRVLYQLSDNGPHRTGGDAALADSPSGEPTGIYGTAYR